MVAFYIRSISCHIEKELLASGIPVQSAEQKRAISQYKTNIQCKDVGPFNCPLVVCMHPIPQQLLERTVAVTSRLTALYGIPIHIGDPSVIGIKDINRPDFGDASDVDGCVPVFWASSLTSHLAIKSAGEFIFKLSFCSVEERKHPNSSLGMVPSLIAFGRFQCSTSQPHLRALKEAENDERRATLFAGYREFRAV